MNGRTLDPDRTRQADPAYWAAALVLAIEARDTERAKLAREQLRRLGYTLETAKDLQAKAVKR